MPNRRIVMMCAIVLLGLFNMGCDSPGRKLYPVRGSVMVNGKPAGQAIVFFHRTGKTDVNEPVPFAKANDDGTFEVTSQPLGIGAVPGEYTLTVVWPDMSKPEDGSGARPDILHGAFEKAATSKFKASVKADENTLPPLEIAYTAPKLDKTPKPDPNNK